jgi:hypothetical protein
MSTPELPAGEIGRISSLVANYIRTQRDHFLARAVTIPVGLRVQVNPFFRPDVLNATHVVELQDQRVGNPEFYPKLEELGFRNLPDFSMMGAITFEDLIVSQELLTPALLFHELVHAEQYRQLGVDRFSELYVQGFLDGGSYEAIPLELNAYALEGKFRQTPHRAFSVEEAVAAWIRGEEDDDTDLEVITG